MNNTKSNTSKPSYRYAIISISIVLYFLGAYLMLFLHSGKIDRLIKEQVSIVLELKDGLNSSDVNGVQDLIKSQDGVIPTSVEYLDKSKAREIMGDEILVDLKGADSPFKEVITFRLFAEYYTDNTLKAIDQLLMQDNAVHDVFFENESDVGVNNLVRKLSLLFLILSVIFVALALIIIHSTLSLSLYADRWEIKTMELVGARKAFIRKPYVAHGRIIGQRAFMLASVALLATLAILYAIFSFTSTLLFWPFVLVTLLILFVISTLITMVSTFTVVNKFLEQKLSDLYN